MSDIEISTQVENKKLSVSCFSETICSSETTNNTKKKRQIKRIRTRLERLETDLAQGSLLCFPACTASLSQAHTPIARNGNSRFVFRQWRTGWTAREREREETPSPRATMMLLFFDFDRKHLELVTQKLNVTTGKGNTQGVQISTCSLENCGFNLVNYKHKEREREESLLPAPPPPPARATMMFLFFDFDTNHLELVPQKLKGATTSRQI